MAPVGPACGVLRGGAIDGPANAGRRTEAKAALSVGVVGAVAQQPADEDAGDGGEHEHDPDRGARVAEGVADAHIVAVVHPDDHDRGDQRRDELARYDATGAEWSLESITDWELTEYLPFY